MTFNIFMLSLVASFYCWMVAKLVCSHVTIDRSLSLHNSRFLMSNGRSNFRDIFGSLNMKTYKLDYPFTMSETFQTTHFKNNLYTVSTNSRPNFLNCYAAVCKYQCPRFAKADPCFPSLHCLWVSKIKSKMHAFPMYSQNFCNTPHTPVFDLLRFMNGLYPSLTIID